jgi:hypothetical protein
MNDAELNHALAEKVMGLKRHPTSTGVWVAGDPPYRKYIHSDQINYTNNETLAFRDVVERMHSLGWYLVMILGAHHVPEEVSFYSHDNERKAQVFPTQRDSVARAIGLAALKAKASDADRPVATITEHSCPHSTAHRKQTSGIPEYERISVRYADGTQEVVFQGDKFVEESHD